MTRYLAAAVLALIAPPMFGHLQLPCGDEKVEAVKVEDLALRGGCYEVKYAGSAGHICVFEGGTPELPYVAIKRNFDPQRVSSGGWTGGGHIYLSAQDAFDYVCRALIENHRLEHERRLFDPDAASIALDEFFKQPAETGSTSFMDLPNTNPGLTVSAPIFTKIDTDNSRHLEACGDLVVRDVPPPDPPPPPTLREMLEQGGTHGIMLVPLVYTWREFDPFDASYDTSVVWRDGENNYWCDRNLLK